MEHLCNSHPKCKHHLLFRVLPSRLVYVLRIIWRTAILYRSSCVQFSSSHRARFCPTRTEVNKCPVNSVCLRRLLNICTGADQAFSAELVANSVRVPSSVRWTVFIRAAYWTCVQSLHRCSGGERCSVRIATTEHAFTVHVFTNKHCSDIGGGHILAAGL